MPEPQILALISGGRIAVTNMGDDNPELVNVEDLAEGTPDAADLFVYKDVSTGEWMGIAFDDLVAAITA